MESEGELKSFANVTKLRDKFGFNTELFSNYLRAYREGITIGPHMDCSINKYKSHCK